jgi:hypothetical protein
LWKVAFDERLRRMQQGIKVVAMAREITTRIVSDLSGEPVPDGEAVTITIVFTDRSRGRVQLDAAETEILDMIEKGRHRPARSRRKRGGGPAE